MYRLVLLKVAFVTGFINIVAATSYDEQTVYTQALLKVRYSENSQNKEKDFSGNGKYAKDSPKGPAKGYLYYAGPKVTWCQPFDSRIKPPSSSSWIALIPKENSTCSDSQKILEAKRQNATAVIIFNNKKDEVLVIDKPVYSMKTVMVDLTTGTEFVRILGEERNSKEALCEILVGTHYVDRRWKVSRTSVLFVLVSFILLMCISLAWLVFYYVQRFRHIYRNDRKEKQLLNAAKKAISKLKTRGYQDTHHEEEMEDTCAICLENYKDGETLRILPCKHEFHKGCIDPWLLNHRTCPMCKSNILKSLGVEIPESVSFQTDNLNDQIRRNLRVAGLSFEPDATIVTVVAPNTVNRYSSSSSVSDADSDRSTIALVGNPRTV